MTVRAIAGLVVFNAYLLIVGAGVLWGLRGWRWWTDFVRLAGVAYLLGLASSMIVLTYEIVLGIPISLATILLNAIVLIAAGLALARRRGDSLPAVRPPGWELPRISLFAAIFAAGLAVYFEGLLRSERLSGVVHEWDSWVFWMPKAEWIYFSGGLEPAFLERMPGASYPPGLSAIHAGAFHFMGSADNVTLHLQYWFFAVGFVAAVAGLLARRVQPAILLPLLLAVLVAPSLVERMMITYADIPLGYLVATAAVLLYLWIEEGKRWQIAAAVVLLAGGMLTKREGVLFAACVLLAAFAACFRGRPGLRGRVALAGIAALALTLPWRAWFTAHGLPGDGPETGYLGWFGEIERVRPSLELAVTTLFDQDLWPAISVIGAAAALAAALSGAWRISVYASVFVGAAIAASGWVFWSNVSLQFTQDDSASPIIRITGTTILVLAALTPLLLQRAWSGGHFERATCAQVALGPDALLWRSRGAWLIVLLGLLSHPGAMLVGYSGSGLPGGAPRFPSTADCVSSPAPGQRTRLVVGYADSYPDALAIRERARVAGLDGLAVRQDGCGRLRVFVGDIRSPEAATALISDARAVGLSPTVEQDGDG